MNPGEDAVPASTDQGAGWAVLHLFCRVPAAGFDREAVTAALKDAEAAGLGVVPVALLGHKADLGMMALGEDPWALRALQSALAGTGLVLGGSYLSVTEVSEYAAGLPRERLEARLHPVLPPEGKPAFCFYPMSKRRGQVDNWYALGFEERKELMHGHGRVGRRYHGRVVQLITGSTGLDDWEWGVTLFANSLADLKECVYEMRFDPASSRFAEFGPFYTGLVEHPDVVLDRVAPR